MMPQTPWPALFRVCFLENLQYRSAAIAGFSTQIAFGILYLFLYKALFESASGAASLPLDWTETSTYLWLVQALLLVVPWGPDRTIGESIMSGGVATELLRPCHLYTLWFTRVLATTLAGVALRCLPVLAFAALFFPFRFPETSLTWILFLASLGSAFLLSTALKNLLHVGLFWTISAEGLPLLFMAVSTSLSGQTIPLALLPDGVANTVRLLPFAGLADTPFTIFLEKVSPLQALFLVALQLGWTVVIVLFSRWCLERHLRHLTIAGG